MEFVIIIAVAVAVFWLLSGAVIGKARRVQEQNPDEYLDRWFDGRDQVIVEQGPGTLTAEAVLAGGNERGYRLISSERIAYPKNNFTRMIFDRQGDGPSHPAADPADP